MMTTNGRTSAADAFVEQRLANLERVSRGLSHEANNWLYSILGQTEMAEQHLRQVTVALRYLDRLLTRAERDGHPILEALPRETLAKLRQTLPRKTSRRRLDGLRRVRHNAEQLSAALHHLHMFAAARGSAGTTIDLNAAVRAAVELLRLGSYRTLPNPPRITLNLSEGLPVVIGSSGLVIGIILDLAAGSSVQTLQVTTRREGEAVVCEVSVSPMTESALPAALVAARLCGGTVTTAKQGESVLYALWLPMAGPLQSLRSGSA